MWRILADLHTVYRGDYGDHWNLSSGPLLPLDPIDVARSANKEVLRRMAVEVDFSCAREALSWLDDILPRLETPLRQSDRAATTHIRYAEHLRDLCASRIIEACHEHKAGFYNPYFAIPKNAQVARATLNAKKLSKHFKVPPVVNLCDPPTVIKLLRRLASAGPLFSYSSDIRHWLHQLEVGERLRDLFRVVCGSSRYRWCSLPMSYSPRICQCLAWLLILHPGENHVDDNQDGLFEERRNWRGAPDPPRFLTMRDAAGNVTGHIFLTYDNIGVFCNSHSQWGFLTTRIRRNMAWANITLKEEHYALDQEMNIHAKSFKGMEYLGLQYGFARRAGARELRWRHAPSRTEKWIANQKALATDSTARQVAAAAGVILWDALIRLRPLCFEDNCISALSAAATFVAGDKQAWDVPRTWHLHIIDGLRSSILVILKNHWCSPQSFESSDRTETVFSDASDTGMGAVYCDHLGNLATSRAVIRGAFIGGLEHSHIYLKELAAARWALEHGISHRAWTRVHIRLVVDNSAVAFGLRAMYSANDIANAWMRGLHTRLQNANCSLEVCQVLSQDNPADEPSRNKSFSHARLRQGWIAMSNFMAGKLSSEGEKYAYRMSSIVLEKAQMRHSQKGRREGDIPMDACIRVLEDGL